MNGPKITIIGAGSYTFGYGVLAGAIIDHRLDGAEVALVDLDGEIAEAMAAIGRRMADAEGVHVKFTSTTDRRKALPGADFVTTSIAVELKARGAIDWQIALKHGLLQTNGECGSIGGLSYTLRSVPLVLSVCCDMEKLCPKATLLNVTNPLTRVCLAASRYSSIKTVGFCCVALVGWRMAAQALCMAPEEVEVTFAGLNHFSWLLDVREKKTGRDLYPQVRAAAERGFFMPLMRKYLRQTNYLPGAGDDHFGEFVPFDSDLCVCHPDIGHGSPQERAERRAQVLRVAGGEEHWRHLHHSWERPMDYVNAAVRNKPAHFPFLNVVNGGAINGLPDDMVVEVPATVDASGAKAQDFGAMPDPGLRLLKPAAETAHWAVEAAVHADIKAAHRAIESDPAISDKAAAGKALAEMLEAHKDAIDPAWKK